MSYFDNKFPYIEHFALDSRLSGHDGLFPKPATNRLRKGGHMTDTGLETGTLSTEESARTAETSLAKAIRLLPIVAARNASGVTLSTVARKANLNTATARRLLQGLVEGFFGICLW